MSEIRNIAAASFAFLFVAFVMVKFHNQFWWPADEGVYAYVAQRYNLGDIIHRDIIDLHAGYGNLLNAFAFRIFGEDLLSLRYPLVALTFLQSFIAYILLKHRGNLAAVAGAVAMAAFSFVQFPNPSANWHALSTFFCLCLCLEKLPKHSIARVLLAGVIVGVCFFTRQLSGVFLALGLVCVLMSESTSNTCGSRSPALLIGGISIAGLIGYLASKQHLSGLFWGGVWPLGLLIITTMRSRMTWSYAIKKTSLVGFGFGLAGLPLAIIALYQGSFSYWVSDILFTALIINGQDFIRLANYLTLLPLAADSIIWGSGLVPRLSGAAWIILILSVPALGYYANKILYRDKFIEPSVVLAVFWAIGALHYQIPIYLLFVLPAVLFAVLLAHPRPVVMMAMISLSVWSLNYQAGQPLERTVSGIISGQRSAPNIRSDLPRVSLEIQAADIKLYQQVVDAINDQARPDEPLMTLPMEPQLNFMTGRESPVHYYATPLGLRTESDVNLSLEKLNAAAPLFVVHRRQDKYLTPLSAKLLSQIQARSGSPQPIGPFDLYRYLGSQVPSVPALQQ